MTIFLKLYKNVFKIIVFHNKKMIKKKSRKIAKKALKLFNFVTRKKIAGKILTKFLINVSYKYNSKFIKKFKKILIFFRFKKIKKNIIILFKKPKQIVLIQILKKIIIRFLTILETNFRNPALNLQNKLLKLLKNFI